MLISDVFQILIHRMYLSKRITFRFDGQCAGIKAVVRGQTMNDLRREQIEQRWREIDAELAAIAECKVTPGIDPSILEAHLLYEHDGLEFELAGR
jgi:hypothetical protein